MLQMGGWEGNESRREERGGKVKEKEGIVPQFIL